MDFAKAVAQAQDDERKNGITLTENGAITNLSTGEYTLDLFFRGGAMRRAPESELRELFVRAFKESPELATRTALFLRDVRQGAGERRIFREYLRFLYDNADKDFLRRVIAKVPELGRWDDLFVLPLHLWIDLVRDNLDNQLLLKWLPREKSKKWPGLAHRIAKELGLSMKEYRKLRAKANTVEQAMSANRWNVIEYQKVPSLAFNRYVNAFSRHNPDRFEKFLDEVRSGKKKINASVISPAEIFVAMKHNRPGALEQWENLPDHLRKKGTRILPMIDVSGSMEGAYVSPSMSVLNAALGLGLYFADKQDEPYNGLVLTFSESPRLVKLHGSVLDKAQQLLDIREHLNTNLMAAFDRILEFALKNNLTNEELPSHLLILSDMEFDSAIHCWDCNYNDAGTVFNHAKRKFESHGYTLPTVVFWNLASRHDNYPVRAGEHNTVLISGYNIHIVQKVVEGTLNELTPWNFFIETISNPRYNF